MTTITIDWLHIAALVGAFQGLLLAGVLAAYRTNRTANRLLGVLVFAFTIHLVSSVYYATGLVQRFPHFFGVSYGLPWLFGPLPRRALDATIGRRRTHSKLSRLA